MGQEGKDACVGLVEGGQQLGIGFVLSVLYRRPGLREQVLRLAPGRGNQRRGLLLGRGHSVVSDALGQYKGSADHRLGRGVGPYGLAIRPALAVTRC
jgi:hypothetical protein